MEHRRRCGSEKPLHLRTGRIPARGDEDGLSDALVIFTPELEEGHSVVGALEEEHPLRIPEFSTAGGGYPQACAAVASGGLALVGRAAVTPGPAPFLESHYSSVTTGDGEREGKITVSHTLPVRMILLRKDIGVAEGQLRPDVDAPPLEEGVERPPGLPVGLVQSRQPVLIQLERPDLRRRFP